MKRPSIPIILIATCLVTIATGNAFCGEVLTMDKAVEAALAANPELTAADHEFRAAQARAPQAATPPDPRFMLDVSQVPINTADLNQGVIEYMVEQEIPFPTKLVYGHRAENRAAKAALAKKVATAQEITREVRLAYLDIWQLEEEKRIELETLSAYRQSRGSATEAYATLKAPLTDVVRTSVELGEVEARLAVIEQERLGAIANLSRLMASHIGPETRLEAPPPIPHVGDLKELTREAKETRPEIVEADNMIESEEARVSFAKSQFGPDLSFRFGYMDMPGNQQNAWHGRVGISVPLWSLSKQVFAVREKKAALARAHSVKEATVLSLESEVKSAHARLMAAKKALDIYANTVVPRAQTLVGSSQEAYRAGHTDFLSVVDGIRSLNNSRLALLRARVDAVRAFADLERAVGRLPGKE